MNNNSNTSNISSKRSDRTSPKLCYILPEYSEKTDSHFFHIYELLEELSKKIDIFLVVEKFTPSNDAGSESKNIKIGKKSYVQKFKFAPLRFLENFLILSWARILGYRIFYTHYGYVGAVNAAVISKLFKGRSYYWNCAMNWLFKQRKFAGLGYRLSLKWSDFLVTGSETMKQGYIEHYKLKPEKIKVMPNWINLDRFNRRNTQIKSQQVENTQIHAEDNELLYSDITYKIRGACFKIWKQFRGAFKEKIIERALYKELKDEGLEVESQKQIPIMYENEKMGTYIPDIIVNGKVLVELKSKTLLTKEDEKQFWLYLKGSEYKLGLLINFGRKLEIKRKVYDTARNFNPCGSAYSEGQNPRISANIDNQRLSAYPERQNQRVSASINNQRESAYLEEQNQRVSASILFVHWLSKRKGADMIVPVIILLKDILSKNDKAINFKLSVIGKGPYKEKLLEEIKSKHLEKFIQVLGGIPNKEIIKHYSQSDIFFMPSMEEGFPRVLLEAMAMGVPYVASDVGSVREISSETAQRFLVKSGDVEMFAHKLAALISDKEIYEKFRKEELENVKKYDLKEVADKFINIINDADLQI